MKPSEHTPYWQDTVTQVEQLDELRFVAESIGPARLHPLLVQCDMSGPHSSPEMAEERRRSLLMV